MKQALILQGHAISGSFNSRLASAYSKGFEQGGGTTELVQLSNLEFDPVLRSDKQVLEPDLQKLQKQIEAANHLVWIFPTYWGSAPAVVRAVLDRVFLPGWAYRHDGGALPTGLLKGRSARLVTTMDSPWLWYWLMHRGSVHASVGTATLSYVGVGPIRYTTVYRVRKLSSLQRSHWERRLCDSGRTDAQRLRGEGILSTPGTPTVPFRADA